MQETPFALSDAYNASAFLDRYLAHLAMKCTDVTLHLPLYTLTIDDEHAAIFVFTEKGSPMQCNCGNGGSVIQSVPLMSGDRHSIFGYGLKLKTFVTPNFPFASNLNRDPALESRSGGIGQEEHEEGMPISPFHSLHASVANVGGSQVEAVCGAKRPVPSKDSCESDIEFTFACGVMGSRRRAYSSATKNRSKNHQTTGV